MPVILSINNSLEPTTVQHPGGRYEPVDIAKPLSIELLTFFPGTNIREWGRKAELLLSSHVRPGPGEDTGGTVEPGQGAGRVFEGTDAGYVALADDRTGALFDGDGRWPHAGGGEPRGAVD